MIVLPENKETTSEKLIKMYPEFLRGIKEFKVIQEVAADILEEAADNVKIIINDSNLTTASESVIEFFENLIGIKRSSLRTLEERRRLVLVYYNIFGKVSATKLKNAIGYYTQEDVAVSFNTKDEDGNYILEINCERGDMNPLFLEDIWLLLKKIIPAHLLYKVGMKYSFAVVIGKRKQSYNYEYELCGTKPEPVLLGKIISKDTVTSQENIDYKINYPAASEAETTGIRPDTALLGNIDKAASAAEVVSSDYVMDYALCGTMTAGS
mgnify:CR=1 FL=1